MCVAAKVAAVFKLATTYFQVKKESYTELKKNEYKNIEQKFFLMFVSNFLVHHM